MSLLETLRKPRLGPFALFDLGGTVLIGLAVSHRFGYRSEIVVPGLIVAGHVVHLLVGQETPGTKLVSSKFGNKDAPLVPKSVP